MADPKTLQISLPGAGKTTTYTMSADVPVKFTFDISEAVFTGTNGNLEIAIEGGGTVILEGYQALADSGNIPSFIMANDEEVPGDFYLFAFGDTEQTAEELETAADGAGGGSGAGEYSDDAGSLGDGIDSLDGQGDAYAARTLTTLSGTLGNQAPVAIDDYADVDEMGDHDLVVGKYVNFYEGRIGEYDGSIEEYIASNPNEFLPEWPEGSELDPQWVTFLPTEEGGIVIYNPNPPQQATASSDLGDGESGSVNYLLMVDTSGSMGWDNPPAIQEAKEAMIEMLETLQQQLNESGGSATVGIIDWDSGPTYTYTYQLSANSDPNDLTNDAIAFIQDPAHLQAAGGTDFNDAFTAANDWLNDPAGGANGNGTHAIFISDGVSYSNYAAELADLQANANVIGVGVGAGVNTSQLDDINEDGPAIVIDSADDLNGVLVDIVNSTADFDADGNLIDNDYDVDDARYTLRMHTVDYVGENHEGVDDPGVSFTTDDVVVMGKYGVLVVDPQGNWDYTLNQEWADELNEGETFDEVFNYTIVDPHGAVSNTASLTVTIYGSNDMPVAHDDFNVEAVEFGDSTGFNLVADVDDAELGSVNVHDYDDQDHDFTGGEGPAEYFFTVEGNVLAGDDFGGATDTDPDDGPDGDVDGRFVLGLYSHASQQYDYEIPQEGNTDEPFDFRAMHPDQTWDVAELPDGDKTTYEVAGKFGVLTLKADGSYSYELYTPEDEGSYEALQALNYDTEVGDRQDTFTYAIMDDSGAFNTAQLTITVNGANDAPEIQNDTNSIVEHGTAGLYEWIQAIDPEAFDGEEGDYPEGFYQEVAQAITVAGNVIAGDERGGQQDFDDDNTPDEMFVGTVQSAVKGADPVGVYVDDNDSDIYNGTDNSLTADNEGTQYDGYMQVDGQYGTLYIKANGEYIYELNNELDVVEELNVGDTLTEHFDLTIRNSYEDGVSTDSDLDITIHGNNDDPTVEVTGEKGSEATFVEDGVVDGSGAVGVLGQQDVQIDDVDNTASELVVTLNLTNQVAGDILGFNGTPNSTNPNEYEYGGVTLTVDNATGTVTLVANGNAQVTFDDFEAALKLVTFEIDENDDTPDLTPREFSIVVTDENSLVQDPASTQDPNSDTFSGEGVSDPIATFTLNVEATNDAPVAEDDGYTIETAEGDYQVQELSEVGSIFGELVNPNLPEGKNVAEGNVLGNDWDPDQLDPDGSADTNENAADLDTLRVTGFAAGDLDNDNEPTDPGQDMVLMAAPVDPWTAPGDTLAEQVYVQGTYGKLYMDDEGNFRYVVDSDSEATNSIPEGHFAEETFTYRIEDYRMVDGVENTTNSTEDFATITFRVDGNNDQATIYLGEGDTASGSVTEIDDDANVLYGEADGETFQSGSSQVEPAAEFEGENNIQELTTGGDLDVMDPDDHTVGTKDGDHADHLPENDPVNEETFSLRIEHGGQVYEADAHNGSITTDEGGTFTINADGTWTYSIDNELDVVQQLGEYGLNADGSAVTPENNDGSGYFTETFTVYSLDGSASQDITVTVEGTNDAPVITNVSAPVQDFESGAAGWGDLPVTETDGPFTDFLGRFDNGDFITKTFPVAEGTETLTIEFDMYEIDSWDNELFLMDINGAKAGFDLGHNRIDGGLYHGVDPSITDGAFDDLGITFTVTPMTGDSQNLGFNDTRWYDTDQIHHVVITIPASAMDDATVTFGSTLNSNMNDESWGIDNVVASSQDANGNPVFAIFENTSGENAVAQFASTDIEGHDVEYVITHIDGVEYDGDAAGNLFSIDGNKLVAGYEGFEGFDFEVDSDYVVTVVPVDAQGGIGEPVNVTVQVDNVNEPPSGEDFTMAVGLEGSFVPFLGDEGVDHVTDPEDPSATGEQPKVMITDMPENGSLFYTDESGARRELGESDLATDSDGDGNYDGPQFEMSGLEYVPDHNAIDGVLLGSREPGDAEIGNWGVEQDDNSYMLVLDADAGISVTTSVTTDGQSVPLQQFTNGGHVGTGIADIGPDEGLSHGPEAPGEDVLTVTFDGADVSYAKIGFDGMAGHFDPDHNNYQNASAEWTAFLDGEEVSSGSVNGADGYSDVLELTGFTFDEIQFTTVSDAPNSNWVLSYIDAEFTNSDSFDYMPVDSGKPGMDGQLQDLQSGEGEGEAGPFTVEVAINPDAPVNQDPTAVNDGPESVWEPNDGGQTSFVEANVLDNDLDVDNTTSELSLHKVMYGDEEVPLDGSDFETAWGTVTFDAQGNYTFTATKDSMYDGQQETETFTYLMTDGDTVDNDYTDGGAQQATLTITVNGLNDAPTVSVNPGSAEFEELGDASAQDLSASGTVSFNDVDTDADVDISASLKAGSVSWDGGTLTTEQVDALTEGKFTASATDVSDLANSTGWTYTANDVDLDFLADGETITFTYTVTGTDNHGATDSADVVITITGTNDAPTLDLQVNEPGAEGTGYAATYVENSELIALTGAVDIADADHNAMIQQATIEVDGPEGELVADWLNDDNLDSGWTLEVDPNNANLLILTGPGANESMADFETQLGKIEFGNSGEDNPVAGDWTFTIKVQDDEGDWSLGADSVITVQAVNDAPVAVADELATAATVYGGADDFSALHEGGAESLLVNGITFTPLVREVDTNPELNLVLNEDGHLGVLDTAETTPGADPLSIDNAGDTNGIEIGFVQPVNAFTVEFSSFDIRGGDYDDFIAIIHHDDGSSTSVSYWENNPIEYANGIGTWEYSAEQGKGIESIEIWTTGDDTDDFFVKSVSTEAYDAPILEDHPVTLSAAQLLGNDWDVDNNDMVYEPNQPLELSITSVAAVQGGHGTPSLVYDSEGNVTGVHFVPEEDYSGEASFTYTISDGAGGSDTATVTLTIAAVNDQPVAGADEDAVYEPNDDPTLESVATGELFENDSDVDQDDLTVSDVEYTGDGTVLSSDYDDATGEFTIVTDRGTLTVDAESGDYTYTANSDSPVAETDYLDSFEYTVTDGNGAYDTADLDITIHGLNDGPVAIDDRLGLLNKNGEHTRAVRESNEDYDPTDLGTFIGNVGSAGKWNNNFQDDYDPDSDDDHTTMTYAVKDGTSLPAGVTLEADGDVYINTSHPDYDQLPQNARLPLDFQYTVTDSHGASDSATARLVIKGVNDAALITGDATGSVSELVDGSADDGTTFMLTESGTLGVTDVDTGEDVLLTDANGDVVVTPGSADQIGSLTFGDDGLTWTYQVDNNDPKVQALGEYDASDPTTYFTETFTVESVDGTDDQVITVTVKGSNDVAEITGDATGSVTELVDGSANDGTTFMLTESGTLGVTDVDTGENVLLTDANGDVVVTPGSADQIGSLTFGDDGLTWTYQVDNNDPKVQALGEYDASDPTTYFTETFTVESLDGTDDQVITVTVKGSNDVAEITGDATGSVTELVDGSANDGTTFMLTESGTLGVTDVDTGENVLLTDANGDVVVTPGSADQIGSLTFGDDGLTWTYQVDNNDPKVQALGEYDESDPTTYFTETFTVESVDGTDDQVITVTVKGSNDAPTLDLAMGTVTYEGNTAGYHNMLGVYTLDADNNPTDPQIIIENIHDSDLSVGDIVATYEGEGLNYFLVDVKYGSTPDVSAGPEFSWNEDTGQWDIAFGDDQRNVRFDDPNLNEGDEWVGYRNGEPKDLQSFLIEATEDGRTIGVDDQFSSDTSNDDNDFDDVKIEEHDNSGNDYETTYVENSEPVSITGYVDIDDIDTGAMIQQATIQVARPDGEADSNWLNADGLDAGWTLEADPSNANLLILSGPGATESMADFEAQLGKITFGNIDEDAPTAGDWTLTIAVQDDQGAWSNDAYSTITVVAEDDPTYITDDEGSVREDYDADGVYDEEVVTLSTSGQVTITDADDNGTVSATWANGTDENGSPLGSEFGTLNMNSTTGEWTFSVDNDAVQHLADGETIVQEYTVTTGDGNDTETVTITINGTEDPTSIVEAQSDISGAVTEDLPEDINASDELEVSGNLTLADVDDNGAMDAEVTWQGAVDEEGNDLGLADQLGTFTVDPATNEWTFTVDNDSAAVQGLDTGEQIVQTFQVKTADGEDVQNITVTINGVDDNVAPEAQNDSNSASIAKIEATTVIDLVVEPANGNVIDGTVDGTVNSEFVDTDADGDQLSVTGITTGDQDDLADYSGVNFDPDSGTIGVRSEGVIAGDHGVLTIDAQGYYTYTPNEDAENGATDVFTYRVEDGNGGVDYATLTIDVGVTSTPAADPQFIVGDNTDETLTGDTGADIIAGDTGGITYIEPGVTTQYLLMLDTSGSMGSNDIAQLKSAVTTMLNTIHGSLDNGQEVKVGVLGFDTYTNEKIDFTLTGGNDASLNGAVNWVDASNHLKSGGWTNYEDVFMDAKDWVGTPSNDVQTQAIFITDGNPSAHNYGTSNAANSGGVNTGTGSYAKYHLLGQSYYDKVNDVDALKTALRVDAAENPGSLRVIGIGSGANNQLLRDIDSTGTPITNVSASNIQAALMGVVTGSASLQDVGNDTLNGDINDDIIFGDSMNTDALAASEGVDLPAGSGADVFTALEDDPNNDWDRADTIEYIKTHAEELAVESADGADVRSGGDDVIHGDAGNDIIFGQEGNDAIYDGTGDDLIYGGSGNDTIFISSGNDTITLGEGEDMIKIDADYVANNGGAEITVTDFTSEDSLDLDYADGFTLDYSEQTNGSDSWLELTLSDGDNDPSNDIVIKLMGASIADNPLIQSGSEISSTDDVDSLIQSIIDSPDPS